MLVRLFLQLEEFCPEVLYFKPKLLGVYNQPQGVKYKYVSHCQFLPKFNIFVLALYDRNNKTSCIEIYAFKRLGVVSDRFLLRSPST